MILQKLLGGPLNAITFDGVHPRDPVVARWFAKFNKTSSGISVNEDSALGYAAVWKAVNLIANDVGRLPCRIYERQDDGGRIRAKDHPSYMTIARRVGQGSDTFTFRKTLQAHALLWGNGYAELQLNNAGEVIGMLPLLPDRTFPRIDNGRLLYFTMVDGRHVPLDADRVVHIKGLGFDGIKGYSVVQYAAESLGLGLAARRFGSNFFGQGANSSGILQHPDALSEEEEKNLKDSFNKEVGGLGESHRAIVLEEGAKFIPLTIPPEQAQFLGTREFEVREVANWFGVPAFMLGDPTRTSYNSLEQERQQYLDTGLDPWLVTWESELDEKVLTDEEHETESHFVEFGRDAILRADSKTATENLISEVNNGTLTLNEARAIKNRPAYGPEGDRRRIPTNIGFEDDDQHSSEDSGFQNRIASRRAERDVRSILNRIEAQATKATKDGRLRFEQWARTNILSFADATCELLDAFRQMATGDPGATARAIVLDWLESIRIDLESLTGEDWKAEAAAMFDTRQQTDPTLIANLITTTKGRDNEYGTNEDHRTLAES